MSILQTLLDLGDATSSNLAFAHRSDVFVSYGDETITESNLLEIRRRHPAETVVKTFSRPQESKTGADWEWRIIGQVYTLKLRVQAKRVQRDGKLKIKHKIRSTGRYQRDQLLKSALATRMKPLYCIYCTELQRSVWKQSVATPYCREYQSGCLLADANDVPDTTRELGQIEEICFPWHHLFIRSGFLRSSAESMFVDRGRLLIGGIYRYSSTIEVGGRRWGAEDGWRHPTIEDLNGVVDRDYDRVGVHKTSAVDLDLLRDDGGFEDRAESRYEAFREGNVRGLIIIDVRGEGMAREGNDEQRVK